MISRGSSVDRDVLAHHTDMVSHRGPDGRGLVVRGAVGLGHRRLSIIDLSDDGLQPMWHGAVPLCIVYNGEIYNYIELRCQLKDLGHTFRTGTDTEVILAAYLEWGTSCVQHFNGMWSFAILDERKGLVFCARDRFGVKPFYWIDSSKIFAFGSEIRQLLPLCDGGAASRERVLDFLVSGLSDHSSQTFHSSVKSLDAGHLLIYDLSSHRFRIERYYSLAKAAPQDVPPAPEEAAARLRGLLTDAIRLRMRSDVRVGTCLSGGLDSSAIAAIASGLYQGGAGGFHAITAISELKENSEEAFAARVVEASKLKWLKVCPKFDDFAEVVETLMETQEEPFGGPSVAMQYFVMKAAKSDGVTVLLDGQGADESLFGYERHVVPLLRDRLRIAGFSGLGKTITELAANNQNVSKSMMVGGLVGSYFPALMSMVRARRLPGARFKSRLPLAWSHYLECLDDAAKVQLSDIQATSLPMLLRYEDRNSMRHSVEARLPFLDYRVVEFAFAAAVSLKIHSGWTKWPLRAAMDGVLPPEVVWRKRKLGFEAPDRIWLERYRPAMKSAVLNSRLLAELFDLPKLTEVYDKLNRNLAWRIYCIAAWERQSKITEML